MLSKTPHFPKKLINFTYILDRPDKPSEFNSCSNKDGPLFWTESDWKKSQSSVLLEYVCSFEQDGVLFSSIALNTGIFLKNK